MGAGTIEIITGGEWNYKKYFTGHSKRIPRSGHDHANLVNLCCIGEIFKMGPICDTCMAVPFSGLSEQSFTVCVALNEGWNYFPNHPQLFFFFYFLNKMRYSWEINNYSKIWIFTGSWSEGKKKRKKKGKCKSEGSMHAWRKRFLLLYPGFSLSWLYVWGVISGYFEFLNEQVWAGEDIPKIWGILHSRSGGSVWGQRRLHGFQVDKSEGVWETEEEARVGKEWETICFPKWAFSHSSYSPLQSYQQEGRGGLIVSFSLYLSNFIATSQITQGWLFSANEGRPRGRPHHRSSHVCFHTYYSSSLSHVSPTPSFFSLSLWQYCSFISWALNPIGREHRSRGDPSLQSDSLALFLSLNLFFFYRRQHPNLFTVMQYLQTPLSYTTPYHPTILIIILIITTPLLR